MELACELNDNDPWILLSSALYCAFCGSIEQARLRAEQSLALSPVPSHLEWAYHGVIRFLCGDYAGALDAFSRAQWVAKTLPAWRAAALFYLGEPVAAREEAQRFLNGIRLFWVGSSAPTDEIVVRWVLHSHPIGVRERWEILRARIAWRGPACRRYYPTVLVTYARHIRPGSYVGRDRSQHQVPAFAIRGNRVSNDQQAPKP